MLGAMFRLFWNSSKRVKPCKASRIIKMLHHSPTRSRLRAIGQAILPKLLRCIEKMYSSNYHYASDMPQNQDFPPLPCATSDYYDASQLAELEPRFRHMPITGQYI